MLHPPLLRLSVYGVLAAESAVFVHFHPIRRILFVLHGIVVSLFAIVTSQGHFHAQFTAPPVLFAPERIRLHGIASLYI